MVYYSRSPLGFDISRYGRARVDSSFKRDGVRPAVTYQRSSYNCRRRRVRDAGDQTQCREIKHKLTYKHDIHPTLSRSPEPSRWHRNLGSQLHSPVRLIKVTPSLIGSKTTSTRESSLCEDAGSVSNDTSTEKSEPTYLTIWLNSCMSLPMGYLAWSGAQGVAL